MPAELSSPHQGRQNMRQEMVRRTPPSALDRAALVETLQRLIECRQEIQWAYLHGSFLEGGPYRDVDIAVWVDPTAAGPRGWRWYEVDLATTLELRLHQPVDIRVLNDAPLAFRYHALKGQLLLVRDWEGLNEMRARTWDDYCDFLPFARQYLREVLSA